MSISKFDNLTKKDISKKIYLKIGSSTSYTIKITNDLIDLIKLLIKEKKTNITNFGTFSIIQKKERIGRNPKNNEVYIISRRKSVSFSAAKYLKNKINRK